jgi:transposase
MKEYIAFDSHKRYTLVEFEEVATFETRQHRVEHAPGAIRQCLEGREKGTPVAVEAIGNWYWIIDEIEQAGLEPKLVHPRKAKLMRGMINKTDKLDVHGLNELQRNRTLPTVWIPPRELRDMRELTRTRMVFSAQRTRLKNRIQATLGKYAWSGSKWSDPYGGKGRVEMIGWMSRLPPHTVYVTEALLKQLDFVQGQITEVEQRLRGVVHETPDMKLLMSLPGIGWVLTGVIVLEVGDITRFGSAERLASYSGTTPRVHSSGGKTRYGPVRPDVNHYLKWAFVEAAQSVCLGARAHPYRHVTRLYRRTRERKGHAKAIGVVARHLAEATYHVLSTGEPYQEPVLKKLRKGQSREV